MQWTSLKTLVFNTGSSTPSHHFRHVARAMKAASMLMEVAFPSIKNIENVNSKLHLKVANAVLSTVQPGEPANTVGCSVQPLQRPGIQILQLEWACFP